MAQEVENFARFYALLGRMSFGSQSLEKEFKRRIVEQCTDGRTASLREMTREEYEVMCNAIELLQNDVVRQMQSGLKHNRSVCLKLMQQLGIDTTDWARINSFCENPRIAGKPFARITAEELDGLAVKLRAIRRRGGLKEKKEKTTVRQPAFAVCMIDPDAPKC